METVEISDELYGLIEEQITSYGDSDSVDAFVTEAIADRLLEEAKKEFQSEDRYDVSISEESQRIHNQLVDEGIIERRLPKDGDWSDEV